MTAAPTAPQQRVVAAHLRVNRSGAGGEQPATEAGHHSTHDEGGETDDVDVDTGPAGRFGVASDGVEVPAVRRAGQHEREHCHDHEHDGNDDRVADQLDGLTLGAVPGKDQRQYDDGDGDGQGLQNRSDHRKPGRVALSACDATEPT